MTQTTALTLFDKKPLPAEIAASFGGMQNNIPERVTTPQLSFRGKAWRVVLKGVENVIYNRDNEPVQTVKVIILDLHPRRSRAYFEGTYEEGKAQQPVCWSDDGVTPDPTSPKKQSEACATCPQAAKGSKITDNNKAVAACGQFKRCAVVPAQDINFEPLLLKIPQTSLWDKDNEENEGKGFFAFDQYMDMLHRNGVPHSASVVTKIRFDPRTSYPKLVFGADDWVPADQHEKVKELVADPRVPALLQSPINTIAERQAMAEPQATAEEAPAPAPAPASAPTQAAAAARTGGKATSAVPPPPARAPRAPKAAAPAAAPAPAPAQAQGDPDDAPVLVGGGPAKPNGAQPAASAVAAVSDTKGIGALVTAWDDDK